MPRPSGLDRVLVMRVLWVLFMRLLRVLVVRSPRVLLTRGPRVFLAATLLWAPVEAVVGPDPLAAQATGVIVGRALNAAGEPATDAVAWLVDLGRRTPVDAAGRFRFDGLGAGSYLVEVTSLRWGRVAARVEAGPTAVETTFVVEPLRELDEIVVTASPRALRGFEAAQPLSVLSGSDLATHAGSSLGETLANEPGVSSTYFGPGSSRPLIRGLGGDRVRILEGGVGVGDASNTSPDHAVSIEPRSAQRIEIVRGPATLLYGSAAIGGVVNVIDRRIPSERPTNGASGYVEGLGGTVADERTGSFDLTGGLGPVVAHLGGLRRETGDYSIPGHAERAHGGEAEEDDEHVGILENSSVETTRGDIGVSVVGERGYAGLAIGILETTYGIPGGHAHEAEAPPVGGGDEESSVAIDLTSRRWDFEAAWRADGDRLNSVKARVGVVDYDHVELEGDEVGTTFRNASWEGRVEIDHTLSESIGGAVGIHLSGRDFEAIGEEAFVPANETGTLGLFLFEEMDLEGVRLQSGLRWERQTVSSRELGIEREMSGLSASAGVTLPIQERATLGVSVARSVKVPTAEELFSNGPHLATGVFELGDPDLDIESAVSVDATLRLREGRLTGAFTVFVNRFADFIYEARTDGEIDGLPVFAFEQGDATFFGYEAEAELEVLHVGPHHLALLASSDYVRTELAATGQSLPRIPPPTLGGGIAYDAGQLHAHFGIRRSFDQRRAGALEEETAGYTLVDASARYRFFHGRVAHELILRGTNLSDAEARSHTSFLKEVAPFPGRDLQLIYRLTF